MLTENLWRCFTSNTFDFFLYRLAYFRFESNNNNWRLRKNLHDEINIHNSGISILVTCSSSGTLGLL